MTCWKAIPATKSGTQFPSPYVDNPVSITDKSETPRSTRLWGFDSASGSKVGLQTVRCASFAPITRLGQVN